jgi:hypothetical protein
LGARSHQHRSRAADEYRSRAALEQREEPEWVHEWTEGELAEQVELLNALVEDLTAEPAEVPGPSAETSTSAAAHALPGMAEDYLAGVPPVPAEGGRLRRRLNRARRA